MNTTLSSDVLPLKAEPPTTDVSHILHKSDSGYRWHILFLNCVLLFGTCYAVDIPAAIKTQMSSGMGSPDNFETMYSLLFTLYSLPNVFFPFFSGYFVDKLGTRYCLLVFTSLVLLGQVIFAIGMTIKSWPVMFLGRILYGFGDASIYVTNSTFIAEYFGNGKELAFAYAFNLSTARVGSVVNNILSPMFVSMGGLALALWVGAMLMALSVISVLLMFPIDIYLEAVIAKNTGAEEPVPILLDKDTRTSTSGKGSVDSTEESATLKLSDVVKLPKAFFILALICLFVSGGIFCLNNIASSLLLERDYFKTPPLECTLDTPYLCQGDGNDPLNCPSSTSYQSPLPVNLTYGGVYYPELNWGDDVDCSEDEWSDGCTKDFCSRFDDAIFVSNTIMSIPYTMTSVLLPLFGLYVDKYGQIGLILLVSSLVCLGDHLLLALTAVTPIVPMIGQGFVYSAFSAAIWPSVPLVVPPKYLSLSFGVIFSFQAIGLTIFPLVMAQIYDQSDNKYIPNVELFLAFIALLGVICSIWVNYHDYKYGDSVLNTAPVSAAERARAQQERALAGEHSTEHPLLDPDIDVGVGVGGPGSQDGGGGGDGDDVLSRTCSDAAKFDSLYGRKVFGDVVYSPTGDVLSSPTDDSGLGADTSGNQLGSPAGAGSGGLRSRSRTNSRAARLSRASADERIKELVFSNKI
jgi:MFS family permease